MVDGKSVEIKEVKAEQRDCRGCFYSVGSRFLDCPTRCIMSTVINEPIKYQRAD